MLNIYGHSRENEDFLAAKKLADELEKEELRKQSQIDIQATTSLQVKYSKYKFPSFH